MMVFFFFNSSQYIFNIQIISLRSDCFILMEFLWPINSYLKCKDYSFGIFELIVSFLLTINLHHDFHGNIASHKNVRRIGLVVSILWRNFRESFLVEDYSKILVIFYRICVCQSKSYIITLYFYYYYLLSKEYPHVFAKSTKDLIKGF